VVWLGGLFVTKVHHLREWMRTGNKKTNVLPEFWKFLVRVKSVSVPKDLFFYRDGGG